MVEQSSNQDIMILTDDSESGSDDDTKCQLSSSNTEGSESKKSVSAALVKVRMNRHLAIKKGHIEQSKDISDLYEF